MNRKSLFRSIYEAILDPDREFTERIYLGLSLVSEIMALIALIGDLIIEENPVETCTIFGIMVLILVLMVIGFLKDKVREAKRVTVLVLVFLINPVLFFFGGGLHGGGVIWIIFTFTYVGLVMTGKWRTLMIILTFLITLICYLVGWFFPEMVLDHTPEAFFIDSFVSLVVVGIICFVMTWLQRRLYNYEYERAQKAVETAEELSKAQNRFFSRMSHEIRTPINSILGLNELILREENLSEEILRDASGIQGSGKMLLSLINDILDFSRIEAGSMEIISVDYRTEQMLSEIINMFRERANEKGLAFRVTIDPRLPVMLYGDEMRIKQILINLLNNAVKYTQEGSVELHVERMEKDEKNVQLSISVMDTGMGIRKESIPHLFDAFIRADEEKNHYIEGTGLGLSIVKQLVELMGGSVAVNSIYGTGSTFTVVLAQGISDPAQIGELNIRQDTLQQKVYECSFRANDVRILIVDDNEMNLEVEGKLLKDTGIAVDKAESGKKALELTLQYHYDVILMDHMMPEMDGIECLENIRNQTGGLNRATPVVVLTANAGSDNRELYNRAGFDGYMVKPVSGEMLENTLVKYISADKLTINSNKMMTKNENINTTAGYSGKLPVIITATSMCDLPVALIRKLHLPILPYKIRTEEGEFQDGVQMSADELIRYINTGKNASSMHPTEEEYMAFFSEALKRAHHVIHIALTNSMSEDYEIASEAAKSFDNVTVFNSECLSSATGIMVLIAHKLVQMNLSVEDILAELETVKQRMRCSFVIDTTEYMRHRELVSPQIDAIARSLNLHPYLHLKNNRSVIGGIWIGKRERAYRKYIEKVFPANRDPDTELVFITYVDVPVDTLNWIKDEISKYEHFAHVIIKQASAAISSNCGPGTFGILYFDKSDKSYNLSSFLEDEAMFWEEELTEEVPEEETLQEADWMPEEDETATEETQASAESYGLAPAEASGRNAKRRKENEKEPQDGEEADPAAENRIMILSYQYSVVVKGMERKLKNDGYEVVSYAEDLKYHANEQAGKTAVQLIYLPKDLLEDTAKQAILQDLVQIASEQEQRLLLIGEAEQYEKVAEELPAVKEIKWMDRPVDLDRLARTVSEMRKSGK